MRAFLVALFALLALTASGITSVAAQDASPTAELDFPDPTDCQVEPRTVDELTALIQEAATPVADASPVGGPDEAALEGAEPADEETVAEINATWREFIACVNANDFLRMFALVSDDKLRRDFAEDLAGATEEQLIAFFAAAPVALEPEMRAPFIPLSEMQVLEDGRVLAVGPGESGQGEILIFVREDNRWLIDDQYDLGAGHVHEEATPAP